MNKLTKAEQSYWQDYLETLPREKVPKNPYVVASYAGDENITDELIALYLSGQKTAASSLLEEYSSEGTSIPTIGWYWIILDSENTPRCIVRTKRVVFNKFKDVPENIAQAEGEGDLSLAYWRQAHRKFWIPFLKDYAIENLDEAIIVTEYFDLVYCK